MTTYPNLNNEPELLKIRSKDDQLKELQYKTEKHDHENIIKSLKNDNESIKKKYKSLNKKKILLIITNFNRIRIGNRHFNDGFDKSKCWHCYFKQHSSINIHRYLSHK